MNKKKIIITGGTGLLGTTAALKLSDVWDITLWIRSHTATFPGIPAYPVRLSENEEIGKYLDQTRPDILIHAAGITSVEECENNQYKAFISNVLTTKLLAQECKKRNIKFVYISTDHLSSDKECSPEEELSLPVNVYAKTKMEGEFEALRFHDEALIVRTNFFTWGSAHRKSLLDFVVDNLRSRKSITLFDDVRFNPLSGETLLRSIAKLLDNKARGVVNVTADESQCLTKYDFGMLVADIFGLDKSFIQKGRLSDNKNLVRRPFNLTLSNKKLKDLIQVSKLPPMNEMLINLKTEEDFFKKNLHQYILNPKNKNVINYGKQSISEGDFEAVINCLDSNWLTQGPKVEEFERLIAQYTGSKYAVAMANWTCGLHMAVLAADVGPGDYVITSPLTFMASSNCAVYAGATPYFVDIDPVTLNLNPQKLKEACEKLGKKVKAIIPVHFAGAPCDMEKISAIAKEYGAVLIEDAAHALGGTYTSGENIGNNRYSDMVGFSFHPVKNITTGEGGMITTNSEKIYRSLLRIRSHGINKDNDRFVHPEYAFTDGHQNAWYHEMQEVGFNYRITDLQCALGVSQFKRLNAFKIARLDVAQAYDREFAHFKNMKTTQTHLRPHSGNHLYMVRVDFDKLGMSRNELYQKFQERGINLHLHYIPVYRQPFYEKNYPQDPADFPEMEKYYKEAVTFPIYSSLSKDELSRIISTAKELIG